MQGQQASSEGARREQGDSKKGASGGSRGARREQQTNAVIYKSGIYKLWGAPGKQQGSNNHA